MYGYGSCGYGYGNSVERLRPQDDGSITQWQTQSGSDHYAMVDDVIVEPTIDGTNTWVLADWTNDNDIDEFIMSNTSENIAYITKIRMWLLAKDPEERGATEVRCNIKVGGSWQTEKMFEITDDEGNWVWFSLDWEGDWTKGDIDDLEVRIKSETSMSKSEAAQISVIYCDIFGCRDLDFFSS